ncbi:hypothetical protein PVK06_015874 [Gossypium arboreum]|uniref:Transposase MuDR plant domain-containing protein n=1 Tax=Gossypium arboreum TaxID=29729 RepID=A0ABR0PYF6_GOSAR|nr:hypothetical protein PVK06_015874 [Gossypium arboreum]
MENQFFVCVFFDGEILTTVGCIFECRKQVAMRFSKNISFDDMKEKISEKIYKRCGRRMSKLFYKFPVSTDPIKFTEIEVVDDEDVETMVALYCGTQSNQNAPIQLFAELAGIEATEDPTSLGEEDRAQEPCMVVPISNVNASSVGNQIRRIAIHNNLGVYMSRIDLDAAHAAEFSKYPEILPAHRIAVYSDSEELFVGQRFKSKEECVFAIKRYSMNISVDYKVVTSKSTLYIGECWRSAEGCNWRIRAAFIQKWQMWKIRKFVGPHTCTSTRMTEDHRKLDSKTICTCIMPMVKDMPTIKISLLIAEMQARFQYRVSYRKAWIAKQIAMEQLYGDFDASYNELQGWIAAMREYVSGTVIELQTRPYYGPDDQLQSGKRIFHRMFWTFDPVCAHFPTASRLSYELEPHIFRQRMTRLESDMEGQKNTSFRQWLGIMEPSQWTQSFDEGFRYGQMTTNLVEGINAVLLKIRHLPISSVFSATFYRLATLMPRMSQQQVNQMEAGHVFVEDVRDVIAANRRMARSMTVEVYSRHTETFRATETIGVDPVYHLDPTELIIEIDDAIAGAACAKVSLNVEHFIDEVYTLARTLRVWENEFPVLPDLSTWEVPPTTFKLVPDKGLRRNLKGRPQSSRIRNEMDIREKSEGKLCGVCRLAGHNRSKCQF